MADLVKGQCTIYRQKSHDQVDKVMNQLHLLKRTPNASFKFNSNQFKKFVNHTS